MRKQDQKARPESKARKQRVGRIDQQLLDRIEAWCDRVLAVSQTLEDQGRSRRITDQIIGSGTSVGANLFEADEAMSTKDFTKCIAIALKELNETRFWIRLITRQGWIAPDRLEPFLDETTELKKILGSIIARTKQRTSKP